METLKINKNNFWIKLYCFLYCCNKNYFWSLPDNTCDLRKALIIGIPLGILFFPVILVFNIINYFNSDPLVNDIKERSIIHIISFFVTFVGCLLFGNYFVKTLGIIGFLGQVYLFTFAFILIIAITGTIFLLITFLCMKGYEVIERKLKYSNKKSKKESKIGVVKELYFSAKEKYCKTIEYYD